MAAVTTNHQTFDITEATPERLELVRKAQEADIAEHGLTIKQALKRYKKAVAWAFALSLCLVMDGYDVVVITSFYGQTQFQHRFGIPDGNGGFAITAAWQSGLSNSSVVGQLFGLMVSGWLCDRIGPRKTTMCFLCWMTAAVFATFFAPSLPVLAFGMAMCGVGWGSFQTMTTAYASEVVPTVLRPYVTAWVCMCWGLGILISSAVVRAVVNVQGDLGWRLPFALQWVWPIPLLIVAYFAPDSPWSCVRRDKIDDARISLRRLRQETATSEMEIEATLALIVHTTQLERAETAGATYLECFKGTNLRRTEINMAVWAIQILCGNAILGFAVTFLRQAGFSEENAFNVNIALSCCYLIGGVCCWFLLARYGRATIYMGGLVSMFICLVIIGALGAVQTKVSGASLGIGIVLVICTLFNMITTGPACYPIVAEVPSGRLRYKTITLGRFVYNLTGIFSNSVTPRMIQPKAAGGWGWGPLGAGFFYAGTNLLSLIWCWFRLPETKASDLIPLYCAETHQQDRTFGEIDVLFEHRIPARKFKYTKADQFADFEHVEKVQAMDDRKASTDHIEQIA